MLARFLAVLAISLLIVPTAAAEHGGACTANGCGPGGWRGRLVPDTIVGSCSMRESCNKHDICYSQCLACGKIHAQPVCRAGVPKTPLKKPCDDRFYEDIKAENSDSWLCYPVAYLYWAAVDRLGDEYFGAAPAEETIRRVREDMEALNRQIQSAPGQYDRKRMDELKPSIRTFNRLDPQLQNRYDFKIEGDKSILAPVKRGGAPEISLRNPEGDLLRQYIDDIDVSRVRINDRPVDFESVLKSTRGLTQPPQQSYRKIETK